MLPSSMATRTRASSSSLSSRVRGRLPDYRVSGTTCRSIWHSPGKLQFEQRDQHRALKWPALRRLRRDVVRTRFPEILENGVQPAERLLRPFEGDGTI